MQLLDCRPHILESSMDIHTSGKTTWSCTAPCNVFSCVPGTGISDINHLMLRQCEGGALHIRWASTEQSDTAAGAALQGLSILIRDPHQHDATCCGAVVLSLPSRQ